MRSSPAVQFELMPEGCDSLPPHVESELARLLEQPASAFEAGIAKLTNEHASLAGPIREWAAAIRLWRDAGAPNSRAPKAADDADLRPGERVGPFTILSEIGAGGMGTVFLAEQREPVRRRVALKVIKLGMDSKAMLARFEVERQALAMMDHAAIAKVLEAGMTREGRSYFAMEYVKGVPINTYCDQNRLTVEERLQLFHKVCSGVQHAHQKGVIHRDLTPNNVLVTTEDGKANPKIIDFGLARATNQRLTERTLFTLQGMILGTPEYMSPEQAGLSGLDVDMRTDVYALGVLLYELLTSKLPFERDELREVGYDAMCKVIREDDPPRPSTKITTVVGAMEEAARLRRTSSDALLRRLRGDLDWIVMKCLEKDRTRRYDTVNELAADVQRHLNNEPVLAHAPTLRYRLAKLAQRHRRELLAACLVVVAVLAGLAGTTTFWLDARGQASAAEEARRGEAIKAAEARTQAELAGSIVRFLREDLFGAVNPDRAPDSPVTVREVLDAAAAKLDGALVAQPAVRAELRRLIGEIYARLGEFTLAEPMLKSALAEQRQLAGRRPTEGLATALYSLAMLHGEWARDRMDRGVDLMEEAIAVSRTVPALGNETAQAWALQLEAIRAHAQGKPAADLNEPMLRLLAQYRGRGESPEQVKAFIERLQADLIAMLRGGKRDQASKRLREELAPFLSSEAVAYNVPVALAGYDVPAEYLDFRLFVREEACALAHERYPAAQNTLTCDRILCDCLLQARQVDKARQLSIESFRRARKSFRSDTHYPTHEIIRVVLQAQGASLGSLQADAIVEVATVLERLIGKQIRDARTADLVRSSMPTAARLLGALANGIAARPEAKPDECAKAVAMAEQALRLTQQRDPTLLSILAAARYRSGKPDEAMALLREAIELTKNEGDRAALRQRLATYEQEAGKR